MKKFIVSLAIALVFALTASTTLFAFSDIRYSWAEQTILKWKNEGRISGYPNGTFRPESAVSRAELISMANPLFGFTDAAETNFTDVLPNYWYTEQVGIAVAAGYINGYPDGTFQPNAQITRQEIAVILSRIFDLTPNTNELPLRDADMIPEWSAEAIAAVYENGLMGGIGDGRFRPTDVATRAEAIVVLERARKMWLKNNPPIDSKDGDEDDGLELPDQTEKPSELPDEPSNPAPSESSHDPNEGAGSEGEDSSGGSDPEQPGTDDSGKEPSTPGSGQPGEDDSDENRSDEDGTSEDDADEDDPVSTEPLNVIAATASIGGSTVSASMNGNSGRVSASSFSDDDVISSFSIQTTPNVEKVQVSAFGITRTITLNNGSGSISVSDILSFFEGGVSMGLIRQFFGNELSIGGTLYGKDGQEQYFDIEIRI